MFTIEETNQLLDEIADEIPADLYRKLNGGIVLLPEFKIHPKAVDNDLFIMGEYCSGGGMGRYIKIYYGSFARIFGHLSRERYREELRKVLVHEIRHHNEALAGYKDLEVYDEIKIAQYLDKKAANDQKA